MNFKFGYIAVCLFVLASCEKNELPFQEEAPQAVFKSELNIGGEVFSIEAGPSNLVAHAEMMRDENDIPLLHSAFGFENCENCFEPKLQFELGTEEESSILEFHDFLNGIGPFDIQSSVYENIQYNYISLFDPEFPFDHFNLNGSSLFDQVDIIDNTPTLLWEEGIHTLEYIEDNQGFYTSIWGILPNNNSILNHAHLEKVGNGLELHINENTQESVLVTFLNFPLTLSLEPGSVYTIPENILTLFPLSISVSYAESNLILEENFFLFEWEDLDSFPSAGIESFSYDISSFELNERTASISYIHTDGEEYLSLSNPSSIFEIHDVDHFENQLDGSIIYSIDVSFSFEAINSSGNILFISSSDSKIPVRFIP
ncbi:MAG: hypothetical protein AAF487_06120 [Bacteroidota bacterium]